MFSRALGTMSIMYHHDGTTTGWMILWCRLCGRKMCIVLSGTMCTWHRRPTAQLAPLLDHVTQSCHFIQYLCKQDNLIFNYLNISIMTKWRQPTLRSSVCVLWHDRHLTIRRLSNVKNVAVAPALQNLIVVLDQCSQVHRNKMIHCFSMWKCVDSEKASN